MKFVASTIVATAIALGAASTAQAQSASPQIPTPVNPAPLNPVATDGTAMAYADVPAEGVTAGRSAFAPLDGFVGIAPHTVNGAFGR